MSPKKLLISIGVITILSIGACSTLMIGGCAVAYWNYSQLPEYVNRESLSRKYKSSFTAIHEAIHNRESLQYSDRSMALSEDIVAIFVKAHIGYEDLYKRHKDSTINGVFLFDRIGKITVDVNSEERKLVVYELIYEDEAYLVCLDINM